MKPQTFSRAFKIAIVVLILILIVIFLLTGCADPREDERRQQTANSAATIYEAATAIEEGAPVAAPAAAIKANASAIAAAQGHPYPTRKESKP